MQLKRIRHRTLDGALAEVMRTFGKDALIIETTRTAAGFEVLSAPNSERNALARAQAHAGKKQRSATAHTGRDDKPALGWTRGFRGLAESASDLGWSNRILTAVEKAMVGTRVRLERPGDPAVTGIARRVLSALVKQRSLEDPDVRALAFVGPTGVGKTTTLAKFAARAIRDRGEQVAIVTLDTYRIAAVEQLRAFADMLGAPFEVAFTPSDLRRFVDRMLSHDNPAGPVDRVLIDTSGRSPHDRDALRDLGEVLSACGASTALCMPAHARARDAAKILEAWSERRPPTAAIVTKTDETDAVGEAFSTLIERGVPVSHVTDGQRVPEDIDVVKPDSLAEAAFPAVERTPQSAGAPGMDGTRRRAGAQHGAG